jgi:hypothetical protein
MGATTTLLYGINMIFHPVNAPVPEDAANPGLPKARPARLPYAPHHRFPMHPKCTLSVFSRASRPGCRMRCTALPVQAARAQFPRLRPPAARRMWARLRRAASGRHLKRGACRRAVHAVLTRSACACTCAQVGMPYHIRVLVPCYKESYDIVTRTLEVRSTLCASSFLLRCMHARASPALAVHACAREPCPCSACMRARALPLQCMPAHVESPAAAGCFWGAASGV